MNLKESMKRFGTKNLNKKLNEGIVFELSPAVFEKMILRDEKVGHQLMICLMHHKMGAYLNKFKNIGIKL